jgi:hypothetical protein
VREHGRLGRANPKSFMRATDYRQPPTRIATYVSSKPEALRPRRGGVAVRRTKEPPSFTSKRVVFKGQALSAPEQNGRYRSNGDGATAWRAVLQRT